MTHWGTGVYILDEGTYYLTAADNSHAAINNILAVKGYTTADGMTAEGNTALVYETAYDFDAETYASAYGYRQSSHQPICCGGCQPL